MPRDDETLDPGTLDTGTQADPPVPVVPGDRPSIVLGTSNGSGMGHLARQAAVGLMLAGPVEPIIFSLSTALPVVARHGLRGEYCPSHHRGWMPHPLWHRYLRDRVSALLWETGAKVFVYDGVAPYLGILRARAQHPEVAFCWVRRGMWQPGANERALAAEPFFDEIIEPGDLAADADTGATARLDNATKVEPVTLLEPIERLPRDEAAKVLGLDPDRPTALVTLGGAGGARAQTGPAVPAIRAILTDPGWQVAVTRSPIAEQQIPGVDPERVHELVGVYPLAKYLNAFDAAVSAAGYNAFHELLYAGVPTVFVPSRATTTDDQVARARWAGRVGLALFADPEHDEVDAIVTQLLDDATRTRLSEICSTVPRPSGAAQIAELLGKLSDTFDNHRATVRERVQTHDLALRDAAMRSLGTSGTTLVRRALGRSPASGPARKLTVEPLLTESLDPTVLRGDRPVEHLLPGSSAEYRTRRVQIARRCYNWPDERPAP